MGEIMPHEIDEMIDKFKHSRDGSYEMLEHCRKNLLELSDKWQLNSITTDNASDFAGNIYMLNSVVNPNMKEIEDLTIRINRAVLVKEDLVRHGFYKKQTGENND